MADGINFTQYQAPQPQQSNPLQMMGQMQEMASRAQAMQQQELQMRAKLAVGQHMQANIDPATGELKKYDFLSGVASDPNASLAFGDVYKMLLENGEIEARTAGIHLENSAKRLKAVGDMFAPLVRKRADGDTISNADISGAIANGIQLGAFKDRKEGMQMLVNLTGTTGGDPMKNADIVSRLAQLSEHSLSVLEKNKQDIASQYAQVPMVTATGQKYSTAARNVPGLLPGGARIPQTQFAPSEEMAGEGTVAPGSEAPARQGGQPSGSPANLYEDLPPGAIRTEAAPQFKRRNEFLDDPEGKHWLNKDIVQKDQAQAVAENELSQIERLEHLLTKFKSGPGMQTRLQVAETMEALGFDPAKIQAMTAATSDADALAAMQAARKEIFGLVTTRLKNALGPNQRYTNFDLESMQKNTFDVNTKPEAIRTILQSMKNIARISRESANVARRYADWSVNNPNNPKAFSQGHLSKSTNDWLRHKGLYGSEEE